MDSHSFNPLHEDPIHFCENTKKFERFPRSGCSCGVTEVTLESLGQGQIELASLLCESQMENKKLRKQLCFAGPDFHAYRKALNLGICALSTFDTCPDSSCKKVRELTRPAPREKGKGNDK